MARLPTFRSITSVLSIVVLLGVLAGVNLFIRQGGFAVRDLNTQNPLYYVQQESREQPDNAPGPFVLTANVDRGDTLAKVLAKAKVARADAFAAVEALRKIFDPKNLKTGQEIVIGRAHV